MAESKQIENESENNTENAESSSDWRLWCRLCAKNDIHGNINVFLKNEQSAAVDRELDGISTAINDLTLATAIGKYFWVNITRGEDLPQMICSECLTLVTSLVNFSERITRVQKLYCILQSTPKNLINMQELRTRFGLLDEEPETLTEVHYVEEKPKLHELEEPTFELENPLTPCPVNLMQETCKTDYKLKADYSAECNALQEKQEEEQEYSEMDAELLLNICDTYSNNDSSVSTAANPIGDKHKQSTKRNEAAEGKKYFQCRECPRAYALERTLKRHMRQEHDKTDFETKLLPCDQCEKRFHSRYNLQRHIQQHQPIFKRKMYPCSSCDKKFTTFASAQSHAQYMHQEERPRPVICEQCGIAVHSLNALKEHLLSHTDYAPYECDVCKKCFKSVSRLKHHKETHDPHKYICPECGMQLNSRPTLNRHRLVHIDQMHHKCDYCGREFKRAKALKNHLILHTGLKPYSCDFCDRTFANGSNCRTHKKKAHPEELAAQEATGGGKTHNRNIPKLEALKAFTKNKDNLSPVATKQSGCFAFGKKAKTQLKTEANSTSMPISSVSIPTIDNIYNHIMSQTSEVPKVSTVENYAPQQTQLILTTEGSSEMLNSRIPQEPPDSSTTHIYSY